MTSAELKSQVKNLIAQGETKAALDLLSEQAPKLKNDIILLLSRFHGNEKKYRMGIMRESQYDLENNRIKASLMSYLDDIKDNDLSGKVIPPPVQRILFLAANPKETGQLQLGHEIREIEESLRLSKKRDAFDFQQRHAVRTKELRRAMLEVEPQIVHFSGHGFSKAKFQEMGNLMMKSPKEDGARQIGIILEDNAGGIKEVHHEALAGLFSLFEDSIQCVFLNACYAGRQADALLEYVPYVVGYDQPIKDNAAIIFASSFYDSLGSGKDIRFSFNFAKSALRLEGMEAEAEKAVLLPKEGE
jgi:hypothetical protein